MLPLWSRYKNWSQRHEARQREIAAGADAGLFRTNARRAYLAIALLFGASLIAYMISYVPDGLLALFLRTIAAVCGVVGLVLVRWVRAEYNNLTKPDPEKPLSILKK